MFILAKQCKIWRMLQLKSFSDWSVVFCFADTGVKIKKEKKRPKKNQKTTKPSKQLDDISENVKYFPSSVSFSLQTGTSNSHSHSADMPVIWYSCPKQRIPCVKIQISTTQTQLNHPLCIFRWHGYDNGCLSRRYAGLRKSIIYLCSLTRCSENKVKHLDSDASPLGSHREHWCLSISHTWKLKIPNWGSKWRDKSGFGGINHGFSSQRLH